MATGTLVGYLLATAFAVFWGVLLLLNLKLVLRAVYSFLKDLVYRGLGLLDLLVGWSLLFFIVLMFLGSLWYSVAPFFVAAAPSFLDVRHLAGMLIDWTLVLFLLAVRENVKELTEALRELIRPTPRISQDPYALHGIKGVSPDSAALDGRPPRSQVIFGAAGAPGRGKPVADSEIHRRERHQRGARKP
jgi:hypothetical protein